MPRDGDSDDSDSDEESTAGKGGDEVGAARWAARLTAMRGFRRVTMPAVVGADLANPLAAEIWALHPWKATPPPHKLVSGAARAVGRKKFERHRTARLEEASKGVRRKRGSPGGDHQSGPNKVREGGLKQTS